MSEKKDSKGLAGFKAIGTFNEKGELNTDWEFDRNTRITHYGPGKWKCGGYTNEQFVLIRQWFEENGRVPDMIDVMNLLYPEPEATAPTNVETTNADDDEIDASWADLPETQDIKTGRDDRVPGKREDVFFNFSAHLDQIVLKDKVTLKMTTSELPESILSNGEVINLSKAAYNEVDVEIRISYWIKDSNPEPRPLEEVIETIKSADTTELPLETPVDAAQDAVLSESSVQTDILAPEAQTAPIETPVAEAPPAAEPVSEVPFETVPAENVTPAADTVVETTAVDF